MKKLVIILLFMFSFSLIAQENWEFKSDKKLHALSGVVISIPSYYLMYNATNDHEVSRNAAWMFPAFAALGKEVFDGMQGKEISFADMSYTIGSALITTFVITRIQKRIQKKWNKKFEIEF